jgi:pimeloyl-ACP methyl ester carboxylesterase
MEQGDGIPVILLHGFPDHARTFRLQLPALAAAGYRAVAPTMRGYESSSQPKDGDYRLDTRLHDILMKPADFPAGLEIVRVSGTGHFLQQERPELINQKLIEHLKASERRTF